jgi:hypothetical protein
MSTNAERIQNIDKALDKINTLAAELSKEEVLTQIAEDVEALFSDPPNENIMGWFDDIQSITELEKEESGLIEKFNNFTAEEKQLISRMLDLVYKLGTLQEAKDVEKRKHWYEKVKSLL